MKNENPQQLTATFNVIARAVSYGKIELTVDFEAPTRDGWIAVDHYDWAIRGINGMADDEELRRIEAAFSKTIGCAIKEKFAAFAASLCGEEFSKTGTKGMSSESEHLQTLLRWAGNRPFDDFAARVRHILESGEASVGGFSGLTMRSPGP